MSAMTADRETRERAVPCSICRRDTFEVGAVCSRPACVDLARQARTCSTREVADLFDVTYTTVDRWTRSGLLGRHLEGLGSGARRQWRDADLEVLWALFQLNDGDTNDQAGENPARRPFLEACADAVRARRVDPAGDLLVHAPSTGAYRVPLTGPLPDVVCCTVLHLQAFHGLQPLSPPGG